MSDVNPDLAAQEVDDELRRDQLNAMWKAYGRYIIGGAVGIVLAVGGTQLYKYQVRSGQETNSAQFAAVKDQVGNAQMDTASLWAGSVPKLEAGYAALAELQAASAFSKAGDYLAAIRAYDALAASTNGDVVLREYAQLMAGLLTVDKVGDLEDARSRFVVLASPGQPWYFSAAEQLAFLDMKQGDLASAYDRFASLADNTGAPQSIGARALQFRDMLERQLPREEPVAETASDAAIEPESASEPGPVVEEEQPASPETSNES